MVKGTKEAGVTEQGEQGVGVCGEGTGEAGDKQDLGKNQILSTLGFSPSH